MSPPGLRFFSIPELAALLGIELNKHDITLLIRTCRLLQAVFTPLFYRGLAVVNHKQADVLNNVESKRAIKKN